MTIMKSNTVAIILMKCDSMNGCMMSRNMVRTGLSTKYYRIHFLHRYVKYLALALLLVYWDEFTY